MPPTTKGRHTEAAFLDAARQCFAEKGYLNTKISDISAAAGRSTGSFYNYYENKEQLLEALLTQIEAELVELSLSGRHRDPAKGVRAAVTAYWTTYKKYLPEMIGVFQMSMLDDSFRQRWLSTRADGIHQVLTSLHRADQLGYPIGLPLDALASALMSVLEFTCWTWLAVGGDLHVSPPNDEDAIEILTAIWFRTVYGSGAAVH